MKRLAIILFSLFPFLSNSQVEIVPNSLGINEGLLTGMVTSIIQDNHGFIWISTIDGLNRYDGHKFRSFTRDPSLKNTPSATMMSEMFRKEDVLFIGYECGLMDLFSIKTQQFVPINLGLPLESGSLQSNNCSIREIIEDENGNFWLSLGYLLIRLHFNKPITECLEVAPEVNNHYSLSHFDLREYGLGSHYDIALGVDGKKLLAAGRSYNLVEIDLETGNGSKIDFPYKSEATDHPYHFLRSFESKVGISFFLHETNSLVRYDGEAWTEIRFGWPLEYLEYTNDENSMLVTIKGGQTYCFDNVKGKHSFFNLNQAVWTIKDRMEHSRYMSNPLLDEAGNVWLPNGYLGIIKVRIPSKVIRTVFKGHRFREMPYMDLNGSIIYGDIEGIKISDTTNAPPYFKTISNEFKGSFAIADDIKEPGVVWAFNRYSLYQIHRSGIFKKFKITETLRKTIFFIHSDTTDISVAVPGELIIFNKETRGVSNYKYDSLIRLPHHIYSMLYKNGTWWLATSVGLLKGRFQGDKMKFSHYGTPISNNSLPLGSDYLLSLSEDPYEEHILWIGTNSNGLIRLNTINNQYEVINEQGGLPNDVIYGILPDDDGNLWLSSNQGLIRFSYHSNCMKNFTEEDGIQAIEFNTNAYRKTATGQLMFGGINGLNIITPSEFQPDSSQNMLYIDGLHINNELYVVEQGSTEIQSNIIEFTKSVVLPAGSSNVTFDFVSINYSGSKNIRYKYYLQGVENEWANEGKRTTANYMNLKPGTYYFRVKSTNQDGVWSPNYRQLRIHILAPWYWTDLAKAVYVLLALMAIFIVLRYLYIQLKLRHDLQLKKVEMSKLRMIDKMKSKMYVDITHEFKTPLSLILGPAEKSLSDLKEKKTSDIRGYQELIIKNGKRMMDLVNQILTINNPDKTDEQTALSYEDVIDYLRQIFTSFESILEQSEIETYFESNVDSYYTEFNKDCLLKIFGNLISNACKYNIKGGYIHMGVNVSNQRLTVELEDEGVGISKGILPNIFLRYYQSSPEYKDSTGIGLALVKELTEKQGGYISVESTESVGTTFIVSLPLEEGKERKSEVGLGSFNRISSEQDLIRYSTEINGQEFPDLQGLRILIIEDHQDMAHFISDSLGRSFRFDFATSGKEGIQIAMEKMPDFIISDIKMPGMSGFEVCKVLKENKNTSHIPIVLLTSISGSKAKLRGIESGADAVLSKPFDKKELILRIKQLIEVRKRIQDQFRSKLNSSKNGLNTAKTNGEKNIESPFIVEVKKVIESNLVNEQFGLNYLSEEMGMSHYQLRKKIFALTGLTPIKLINEYRIHKAETLLRTSELNISEIAFEVGFSDPQYFNRVFVKVHGISPFKYRSRLSS